MLKLPVSSTDMCQSKISMLQAGYSLLMTINCRSVLPEALLDETLWTLNALFPSDDINTVKLLNSQGMQFHKQPPFGGERNLSQYRYWQERLTILNDLLHLKRERSLKYVLFDKQNSLQLYGFWTGSIAFILAVVSSIITAVTAVIQTRATLEALQVSKVALELSQESLRLQQQAS